MLSIKTTDVIEQRPEGALCGSEVHIEGAYNRLLGEYEALSTCLINKILEDCGGDSHLKIMFADNFAEILNNLGLHLIEEVKNA